MRKIYLPGLFWLLVTGFILSCQSSGNGPGSNENADSTGIAAMNEPDSLTTVTGTVPADLADLSPEEIVVRFFEAIGKKDFKNAQLYRKGEPAGYEDLAREYKNVQAVRLTVTGETEAEAAAGTAYASVPVSVEVIMTGGDKKILQGSYRLSRPNSREAADGGWRIYSEELEDAGAPASGAGVEEKVQYIRGEFKAINEADYTARKHTLDCGDVTYYVTGEEVRKIKKNWFAGDYGGDEEYYFKNGQLIFAYFWDEGGPANGKVTRQECRYYFYKGEMIRILSKGPRTCLEGDQVAEMASDAVTAYMRKDFSKLNCFGD